jgi:hypothetical protein
MKTKKYVIAIAIFGGMLFLANSVETVNQDGEQTAKIEKKLRKISKWG